MTTPWSIESHRSSDGQFIAEVRLVAAEILYTTDPAPLERAARRKAEQWLRWFHNAPQRRAESIYYILQVPETWAGPPPNAHAYSGLHIKIGRTRDVLRRLQNLKTGTSGQLVIHAMEPGSPGREKELHNQFLTERRSGEWFSVSPLLMRHVFATWKRHRLLPPEHQQKMRVFCERLRSYRTMRKILGKTPDMVNPSLHEKWEGAVWLDLVYTDLLKHSE